MCSLWITVPAVLVAGCGGGDAAKSARACAVYAADGSAEIAFAGAGASGACDGVLHGAPPRASSWTRDAVAPQNGHPSRDLVCRLSKGQLTVTIFDVGLHTIGVAACGEYASAGWA
jgi:hypothetical protein